jgi:hypothetical protein
MLATSLPSAAPSGPLLRLASGLAVLLTIFLLAGLGLARPAAAEADPSADPGAALVPLFEDEGEGECEADDPACEESLEDEECEAFEEEDEECEEEAEAVAGEAPAECLLTTARPRISIAADQQKLRLDVRYTLTGPADVAVSLRSSGGKGAMAIAASRHHLTRSGILHESAELSEEETERALTAKRFTVKLRVLGVPSSCQRYDSRQLSVKRGGDESPVFSETSADLRAGR